MQKSMRPPPKMPQWLRRPGRLSQVIQMSLSQTSFSPSIGTHSSKTEAPMTGGSVHTSGPAFQATPCFGTATWTTRRDITGTSLGKHWSRDSRPNLQYPPFRPSLDPYNKQARSRTFFKRNARELCNWLNKPPARHKLGNGCPMS